MDTALHAQLVDILAEARRRIQIHASNASHAKRKAKAKLEKDAQDKPAGRGQKGARAKTDGKKTGGAVQEAEAEGGKAKGGRGKQAAKAKASGGRTRRAIAAAEAEEAAAGAHK